MKKMRIGTFALPLLAVLLIAAPAAGQVHINSELGMTFGPPPEADLESTVINIVQWLLFLILIVSFLLLALGITMTALKTHAMKKMRERHALQYGINAPWQASEQEQYHAFRRSRTIFIIILCAGGAGIVLSLIAWTITIFVVSQTAVVY
ncbi:MAG: hypothetical protein WC505_03755 [Patescibacteria group bacterium]